MGKRVTDRIRDALSSTKDTAEDELADATGKKQVGFNPDVCRGCPHRGGGALRRCGLCGCPTLNNYPLDKLGMVPEGCPRMEEHANDGR